MAKVKEIFQKIKEILQMNITNYEIITINKFMRLKNMAKMYSLNLTTTIEPDGLELITNLSPENPLQFNTFEETEAFLNGYMFGKKKLKTFEEKK